MNNPSKVVWPTTIMAVNLASEFYVMMAAVCLGDCTYKLKTVFFALVACSIYFFIMQSSGTYQAGLALPDAENTQLDARK